VAETNSPELIYLWYYFLDLADARRRTVINGQFWSERLTFQEILAWTELTGNKLLPWELQCVVEIDRIACAIEPKKTRSLKSSLQKTGKPSRGKYLNNLA